MHKLQDYLFHQSLQKTVQTSLLILSLITLLCCKQISGYFANYNSEYWFDYFIITERFSMLIFVLSVYNYLKQKCWLIFELILFFLLQDFIDRVFFNVGVWNTNDTIGLVIIGIQLIIKVYGRFKK